MRCAAIGTTIFLPPFLKLSVPGLALGVESPGQTGLGASNTTTYKHCSLKNTIANYNTTMHKHLKYNTHITTDNITKNKHYKLNNIRTNKTLQGIPSRNKSLL